MLKKGQMVHAGDMPVLSHKISDSGRVSRFLEFDDAQFQMETFQTGYYIDACQMVSVK